MGDASRNTLRGLLIEDPRFRDESSIWTAESTGLTQAGRALGRPTTTDVTSWRIEARGDSEQAIDVQCLRGGVPGSGLGAVWKLATEGGTSYRGQDAPVAIRHTDMLARAVSGGSYESYSNPDTVTLQNGKILVVSEFTSATLGVAGVRQVRAYVIDSGIGTIGSPVTVSGDSYVGERPRPFLIVVPREDGSDRILCGQWVEDAATGGPAAATLDLRFSDDDGATWAIYARSVLSGTTTIDGLTTQRDGINIAGSAGSGSTGWDLRRCRAAYANGQILLMMHLVHHDTNVRRVGDYLLQWQSADLGATFTIVDEPTDKAATADSQYRGGAPVVRARDGLFHVARLQVSDAAYAIGGAASLITVGVQVDRLGAAAQRFTDTGSDDSSAPTLTDGGEVAQVGSTLLYTLSNPDCALALVPAGELAVYWRRPTTGTSGQEIRCALSTDGSTFTNWGASMFSANFGTVWDVDSGNTNPLDGGGASGITNSHPSEFAATGQGGRVAFATSWIANGTSADASLSVLMLGGYHTQTLGSTSQSAINRQDAAVGWEQCWYSIQRPDYVRWTRANTSSNTRTFTTAGMQIVTDATGTDSYTLQPDGSGVEGLRARWVLSCATGNTSGDFVAVRLIVRDGSNTIDVSIRYSSSSVLVRDNHAGSTLVTASVDMTIAREFEIAATVGSAAGDLVVYQRQSTAAADEKWSTLASVAPSLASSVAALHSIAFGVLQNGITNATWREFFLTTNNHTGLRFQPDVAIANPADLQPVFLAGRWSELSAGAFVRSVDGPGAPGEAYEIPLAYQYGVERILPAVLASPSQGWRSTTEGAQNVALAFNPAKLAAEESGPMGDTWGVHLAGINWASGTLQGYDTSSSAWTTITALDFETAVTYARKGNVVELTSGSLTRQINESEWDGAWIDLGSNKRRRITHTRGGLLTASGGTVRRPRLILADVDGTEGASGSAAVYPLQATVIVRNATTFAGVRIQIDAQSTPDGYFKIGSAIVGPFLTFGLDYSWGRILETAYNVEINESRGGQRMPYEVGPARRTVDVAWTDGVDVTQIDGDSAAADYMLSTSSAGIEPAAYNQAVPYDIRGTVDALSGPLRPVVYVPAVAKGTPDSETLTGRSAAVYGRITSPIRLESILGDEDASEVWRLARLTIQEEV